MRGHHQGAVAIDQPVRAVQRAAEHVSMMIFGAWNVKVIGQLPVLHGVEGDAKTRVEGLAVEGSDDHRQHHGGGGGLRPLE